MNFKVLFLIVSLFFAGSSNEESKIRVFMIGDSTMANKGTKVFPETGWGQVFDQFFDDQVEVHNHAKNGRSTKSFIDEGRWQTVYESLKPGDYVFIEFGHNDEKKHVLKLYADPYGTYSDNLIKFITESRSKGAIPILLTSIARRRFNEKDELVATHGEYPAAMKKVAERMDVPLIDMEKHTSDLLQTMGVELSKNLFLWVESNDAFPSGRKDNTHLNVRGAQRVAGLAAAELKKLPVDLAKHVVIQRPVVGIDNWFNREISKKTGEPFHYLWSDTLDSGFSQLGDLFIQKGAKLKTIDKAPVKAVIGYLDVYIIVDPDTTTESKSPNYISSDDVTAISNWVKAGGTLLLMANDGPNCEFSHFNQLAESFGFHFNPVTLNSVVGKNWEMGAETKFTEHKLFNGLSKIYMKEIAGIELSKEAKPVLKDNGDGAVIIAETSFGKGRVLAIGDPWLYNEYIGHSRLPESFENKKAASNLVDYLLLEE